MRTTERAHYHYLNYNNISNDSISAAMDAENQGSGGAKNSSSQSKTSA